MATCPHCAEDLGVKHLFRPAETCRTCDQRLRTLDDGRVETWAIKHGQKLLDAPRPTRYWMMLGVVVVASALVGGLPTAGVLPALLLLPLQLAALNRMAVPLREHMGPLHAVTSDFYASILLGGLAIVDVISNVILTLAPPLSAAVSVAAFLIVWKIHDEYNRWHLRRESRAQRPVVVELVGIAALVVAVVVPPVVLAVVVVVIRVRG
jgi:hypothetical protein